MSSKNDGAESKKTQWDKAGEVGKKKRRGRKLLVALVGVVVLFLLVVALTPMVVSMLLPGIVSDKASAAINGRVELGKARVAWLSSQRVENLTVYDEKGEVVARLNIVAPKSLLGILTSGGKPGEVRIGGDIHVVRRASGETNLETIVPAPKESAPEPEPAAGPVQLPSFARGAIVLDALNVTVRDESVAGKIGELSAKGISGRFELPESGPITAKLGAKLNRKTPSGQSVPAGSLDVDATVADAVGSDGTITPENASIDAKVTASELALDFVDVLAAQEGKLVAALGPRLNLDLEVKGTKGSADAKLALRTESVSLDAPVTADLNAGRVRANGQVVATLDTGRLSQIIPDRENVVGANASTSVSRFPRITLTVRDLDAAIPMGESLDLRGTKATIVTSLGEADASVQVPGAGRSSVQVPASEFVLSTPDLAQGVTLRGSLAPTIDGEPGGTLNVDLAVSDLLDGSGAPSSTKLPTLRGELVAQKLTLAILQPIVEASGLDVSRDIGPTLDLALRAAPVDGSDATKVVLKGSATNLSLNAGATLDGSVISAPGDALTLRIDKLGPALASILGESQGVSMGQTGPLTLTVRDLHADTQAIGADRFDSVTANIVTTLQNARAKLELPAEQGGTTKVIDLTGFELGLDLSSLASGAGLTAKGVAQVDGQPAGTLSADFKTSSMLTESGSLRKGVPASIKGDAKLSGLDTSVLAPFLEPIGLVLKEDIGPRADIAINAASISGDDTTTRIAVDMTADTLEAHGGFLLTSKSLKTTDRGFILTHKAPYRLVSRFVPEGTDIRVDRTGFLQVSLNGVDVPLDENEGAPRPEKASANLGVDLRNGELTLAGKKLTVAKLNLGAALAPGADPRLTFSLEGTSPEGELTGTGEFQIRDAFAPSDKLGVPVPEGRLAIQGIPPVLADLGGAPIQTASGPVSLGELASTAVGPRTNLVLTTTPSPARDAVSATVRLKGAFLNASADVTAAPQPTTDEAPGAWKPKALSAAGTYTSTPNQLNRFLGWFAPEQASMMSLRDNAVVSFNAKLDKDDQIKASLSTEGIALSAITVPGAEGAQPTTIPASTLVFRADAQLPANALADTGTATAKLNLNAKTSDNTRIAAIEANTSVALAKGAPAGPLSAKIDVSDVNSPFVDALLGQPGLLSGAVGDTFAMSLTADGAMSPATTDAQGEPVPGKVEKLAATLRINAPKLKTSKPFDVKLASDRLTSANPAQLTWEPDASWLSRFLEPKDGSPASLTIDRIAPVNLVVNQLDVPMGAASTEPPKVGIKITSNKLFLMPQTGESFEYANLLAQIDSAGEPGTLNIKATIDRAAGGKVLDLSGKASNMVDDSGAFAPRNATLDADLTVNKLATALVDAIANANNQIVGVMGPSLSATAKLRNLPRQGGVVAFDARSDHADAHYNGVVRPGKAEGSPDRLVLADNMTATLHELDNSFGFDLTKFLPIVANVVKDRQQHDPAQITATLLAIPVDGNIKDVRVDSTIDPGEVRFELSKAVATLLKVAGQKGEGLAGQRIEPISVTMNEGVLTYSNLKLPVGEYVFESKGSQDLINQTEDIWLYIPAGAVAGDVIGALGNVPGFGGSLNEDAMMPFRRQGPIGADNPWKFQLDAMTQQLFDPKSLIDGLINRNKP